MPPASTVAVERVMRAAVLTRYGDVQGLEVRNIDEPRAGAGDLKLRIAASSLNALDMKLVTGALKDWFPLRLPAILGFDASGEVVEIGPGASGFQVGDSVFGQVRHGLAEYATAPVAVLARRPAGLSPGAAAALPGVGLTGAQLIAEAIHPKPRARLL